MPQPPQLCRASLTNIHLTQKVEEGDADYATVEIEAENTRAREFLASKDPDTHMSFCPYMSYQLLCRETTHVCALCMCISKL